MYPVSDEFNDPRGRWTYSAPWDDTIAEEVATPAAANFLATQEHVDLRSFRIWTNAYLIPVPQYPDLDTAPQSALDAEYQTAMETKLYVGSAVGSEGWYTE